MDKTLRAFVAELIGTFALVFLSAGAVCAAYLPLDVDPNAFPTVLTIAVAQGVALAVALSATMHLSGGFLNPAVTITLWVLRRLDNREAGALLAAQLLGGVLAGAALRLIFASSVLIPAHFGTPHVTAAFGEPSTAALASAAGIEVLLTFLLTFVIFGTALDPRAPRLGGLGPGLFVGLALVGLLLVGYHLTGVGTNPARAFGTAVWEWTSQAPNVREQVLVYWIGPIVGALLAGLAYTYLLLPAAEGPKAPAAATPAARGKH
jgi:aquaporin Z